MRPQIAREGAGIYLFVADKTPIICELPEPEQLDLVAGTTMSGVAFKGLVTPISQEQKS